MWFSVLTPHDSSYQYILQNKEVLVDWYFNIIELNEINDYVVKYAGTKMPSLNT